MICSCSFRPLLSLVLGSFLAASSHCLAFNMYSITLCSFPLPLWSYHVLLSRSLFWFHDPYTYTQCYLDLAWIRTGPEWASSLMKSTSQYTVAQDSAAAGAPIRPESALPSMLGGRIRATRETPIACSSKHFPADHPQDQNILLDSHSSKFRHCLQGLVGKMTPPINQPISSIQTPWNKMPTVAWLWNGNTREEPALGWGLK